jgi:ATP synthase subunit 6
MEHGFSWMHQIPGLMMLEAHTRNVGEVLTEFISNLAESVIGHDGPKYVPLFASLFLFILVSNLIGLIPGFTPPTDNFNVTLALGVVSFVAYNYYGLQAHGVSYLKQFMGPLLLLAPLMIVVELFSHLFRPASLAIRLYGNMFADHLLLGIFTGDLRFVGAGARLHLAHDGLRRSGDQPRPLIPPPIRAVSQW